MPARRQFEHGDVLSQRTLRVRHVTQLRGLACAAAPVAPPLRGEKDPTLAVAVALALALFSGEAADPPKSPGGVEDVNSVSDGTCDMVGSSDWVEWNDSFSSSSLPSILLLPRAHMSKSRYKRFDAMSSHFIFVDMPVPVTKDQI